MLPECIGSRHRDPNVRAGAIETKPEKNQDRKSTADSDLHRRGIPQTELLKVSLLWIQFASRTNLIRMRLMRMTDTVKNTLTQGIQQSLEITVSLRNLIRMKVMTLIHILKNIMTQEFHFQVESRGATISKRYESIDDLQDQAENRSRKQISDSQI
jgi:hypothetical protein